MSKPKRMPDDIKQECLWVVRGYKRRVEAYHRARSDIINGSPSRYITIKDRKTGKEERVYNPHSGAASRNAEDKMFQLEAIESWPETLKMRAVEQAKMLVGLDLPNEGLRSKLQDALILSCEEGRKYPYEILAIDGIGRTNFYDRRTDFLYEIAKYLNYL